MSIHILRQAGLTASCVLLLAACSSQRVMMPTPNVYVGSGAETYEVLPQELKSTHVPLFYVTDRVAEKDENGQLKYGYGRSPSLAFGSAVVDLGEDYQLGAIARRQPDTKASRKSADESTGHP